MVKENRKVRVGRVVSDKMDKTVVVAVRWQQRHRIYKKNMRRVTKFYTHDKDNTCKLGDLVRIEETRPISRTKRWRVLEIIERREIAEVSPIEIDEETNLELDEDEALDDLDDEDIDLDEDEALDEEE